MKNFLSISLSILIGAVFIFSAYSKLIPMEPFEYQFVDIGVASWKTAPYWARIFVSLEFFLGMLLIFHVYIRKFTAKFSIALLLFFTAYLVYKIIVDGNIGNCGCFGLQIKMTPLQGIIKNVVLIFASAGLYVVSDDVWLGELILSKYDKTDRTLDGNEKKTSVLDSFRSQLKTIIFILGIASLCLGFFIYPVDVQFHNALDRKNVNYKVPLELMYTDRQQQKPSIDLTKGKHVVAFLSLTCPHCRIAAQKIHVMHKKNPSIPFYLALNGDKEKLAEFFGDTHTEDIPHNLFLGPMDWMQVAGANLPVIMFIDDGIVQQKHDGMDLEQNGIEEWLKSDQ